MATWTDEQLERCRTMWADGMSASVIGAELGFSRNAVIGKVHRCGMDGPNSWRNRTGTKPASQQRPHRRIKRWSPRHLPPAETPPPSLPESEVAATPPPSLPESEVAAMSFASTGAKTFFEADFSQECRWPLGTPGDKDFAFCCAPLAHESLPYCPNHFRIAVAHGKTT